jgi:hypothetical protein
VMIDLKTGRGSAITPEIIEKYAIWC